MTNKIKEYREKRGLSQMRLAEVIGVKHNSVWLWEHDKSDPSLFNAICLAQALGTTVEELFSP